MSTISTEPMIKIQSKYLKKLSLKEIQAIVNLYLEIELERKKEYNSFEFWEIDYKDLTEEEKKSIDRYNNDYNSFNFVNVREYLWLKK